MTLLELMFVVIVCAVLAAIATGTYQRYVARVRVQTAITDIGQMQLVINKYRLDNDALPPTLADCGLGGKLDPWGNPYQYLDFTGIKGNGKVRKDHNLVPINSDYDLYSMGPDGASASPLTAKASRDDIVRANDGAFIGKAEDY
jgi:general secretion pathway protein G